MTLRNTIVQNIYIVYYHTTMNSLGRKSSWFLFSLSRFCTHYCCPGFTIFISVSQHCASSKRYRLQSMHCNIFEYIHIIRSLHLSFLQCTTLKNVIFKNVIPSKSFPLSIVALHFVFYNYFYNKFHLQNKS